MAAEMPWHVARMSVGKTSPGSSQVVALGPNWPARRNGMASPPIKKAFWGFEIGVGCTP